MNESPWWCSGQCEIEPGQGDGFLRALKSMIALAQHITFGRSPQTTKHVDQFLTTNAVISDTPAGHSFADDHPQLQ
jgi:hypothetical protein